MMMNSRFWFTFSGRCLMHERTTSERVGPLDRQAVSRITRAVQHRGVRSAKVPWASASAVSSLPVAAASSVANAGVVRSSPDWIPRCRG